MARASSFHQLPQWSYKIFQTEFIYFQVFLPCYLMVDRMKQMEAALNSVSRVEMHMEDYIVFDKIILVSGPCDEAKLTSDLFKEYTARLDQESRKPENLIEVSATDFINSLTNFAPKIKSKKFYTCVAYIHGEWLFIFEGLDEMHDLFLRNQEHPCDELLGSLPSDYEFLSTTLHCTKEQFELEKMEFRKRLEDNYNRVYKVDGVEFDELNEVNNFMDLFVNELSQH